MSENQEKKDKKDALREQLREHDETLRRIVDVVCQENRYELCATCGEFYSNSIKTVTHRIEGVSVFGVPHCFHCLAHEDECADYLPCLQEVTADFNLPIITEMRRVYMDTVATLWNGVGVIPKSESNRYAAAKRLAMLYPELWEGWDDAPPKLDAFEWDAKEGAYRCLWDGTYCDRTGTKIPKPRAKSEATAPDAGENTRENTSPARTALRTKPVIMCPVCGETQIGVVCEVNGITNKNGSGEVTWCDGPHPSVKHLDRKTPTDCPECGHSGDLRSFLID